MGFLNLFGSKANYEKKTADYEKRIAEEKQKIQANQAKNQARVMLVARQRELQQLKELNTPPEIKMMKSRIKEGAGKVGSIFKNTAFAGGKAFAQASKNASNNSGNKYNMLNNVLGIKRPKPQEQKPRNQKMVFVLKQ